MKYIKTIVNTGLAKSHELNTTVYPFILRNITLSGIDCVYAPYNKKNQSLDFIRTKS